MAYRNVYDHWSMEMVERPTHDGISREGSARDEVSVRLGPLLLFIVRALDIYHIWYDRSICHDRNISPI